ncbi:hypothetical protein [Methylotenera sp.]|uniref:hypothetical protein n=1 Tax=Methylotenera sp. TaxID=2051956 RepID=UPI00248960C8|nr:hypothetical protein [Methylotenera sp.]MDI1360629.1 hypothetical protein [Methylotenera sp.]
MSAADRGKKAEKAVATYLTELSSKVAAFDWHRVYDARSAGGRFAAQPGDFAFYAPGLHGLIEVKEVEHEFRLPKKNFDNDQIAKLRKRELAGGEIGIVINFYTLNQTFWRLVPLTFFRENLDVPSWDLREFPKHLKAKDALDKFFERLY